MTCQFIPPYLLDRIAASLPDDPCYPDSLVLDREFRRRRRSRGERSGAGPVPDAAAAWVVHTAGNETTLPGTPARSAGQPESGDVAVDEAAFGVAGSLALFSEIYDRSSYDDAGATVRATAHYGRDYVNAFWDGEQLVFGDGDDRIFDRFTKPVDVLGHEFTHAVVEYAAGLAYEGQPGALNESVADAFAACLKQRLLAQTPDQADWLIGAELFRAGIDARALRDMARPGTAYDAPALGADPQVGHMDDYVETTDDNGGVHINSGIPNRAFHLAAKAIGGNTWAGAGGIWYAALAGDDVGPDTDFAGFAAATIAAAGDHADAVSQAWADVGVTTGGRHRRPGPAESPGSGREVVAVRRSGGFIGSTVIGEVDLDRPDDDRVGELRSLVDRIDLTNVAGGRPYPDMYSYEFDLRGSHVTVPEHELTPELRRLAELVLADLSR